MLFFLITIGEQSATLQLIEKFEAQPGVQK
jgi:hypothetical protein